MAEALSHGLLVGAPPAFRHAGGIGDRAEQVRFGDTVVEAAAADNAGNGVRRIKVPADAVGRQAAVAAERQPSVSMKFRPISPDSLARPAGAEGPFELSSRRGDSTAPQASTTLRAAMKCRPSASRVSTPLTRSFVPATMRSTVALVRTSQRPSARALAMKVTSALPLSSRGQPRLQLPQ
jgi:hypothetical protein